MRVLVTGAGGMLGAELVATCTAAGDDVIAADHRRLDVGDRDQVLGALTTLQPDAVIHTACWTAVDACETDVEKAFRVNALGSRNVAEGARLTGAHLVAISTDYVFDGTRDRPYHEWDEPNPQSVYAASKRAGEVETLTGCPGAAVVRTAGVQGAHGANIVKTVLRLAADPDRPLAFVDDQHHTPTFTADLAPLLRHLAVSRLPGTFHATNQGPTTWFEFVHTILTAADLNPGRLRPISTEELDPPRPAPRPAYSVLDNVALRQHGIAPLPDWHDALDRLLKELA